MDHHRSLELRRKSIPVSLFCGATDAPTCLETDPPNGLRNSWFNATKGVRFGFQARHKRRG